MKTCHSPLNLKIVGLAVLSFLAVKAIASDTLSTSTQHESRATRLMSALNASSMLTIGAQQDAQINKFAPDYNYGSDMEMSVYNNQDNEQFRSLVQFDIEHSLPENALISHASLELSVTNGYNLENLTKKSFRIYRVMQEWSEDVVNWNQATQENVWATAGGSFNKCSECSISGIEGAFLPKVGKVKIDITRV